MHDFQWIVSAFLLRHLRAELIVTLAILLAVIAVTAAFVAIELRRNGDKDNADQ